MKCSLWKTALRWTVGLSLTTLFLCVVTMATTHAQELVIDGGFENPTKFRSLWNPTSNPIACGQAELTQDHVKSGNYSAKITAHNNANCSFYWPSYVGIQQYIQPTANTEYVMTFWILGSVPDRTDGEVEATPPTGGNDISLGIDSKNNTTPITPDDGEFIITPANYNIWTKVTYYWNSGSGNSEFSIDIGSYTSAGGVYYLDDFSIVPAGSSSGLGTGLLADYGAQLGLFFYQNGSWKQLSGSDPEYMVQFDGGIAVDFANGLFVYDGTSWQNIGGSPENTGNTMVAYNSGLAADYGSSGLFLYQNGNWKQLSPLNPEYLAVFEGKLAADFGSAGLQVYDGTSWQNIGGSPENTGNTMIGID